MSIDTFYFDICTYMCCDLTSLIRNQMSAALGSRDGCGDLPCNPMASLIMVISVVLFVLSRTSAAPSQ